MIFLFPRWDMLVPWRVSFIFLLKASIFWSEVGKIESETETIFTLPRSLTKLTETQKGSRIVFLCHHFSGATVSVVTKEFSIWNSRNWRPTYQNDNRSTLRAFFEKQCILYACIYIYMKFHLLSSIFTSKIMHCGERIDGDRHSLKVANSFWGVYHKPWEWRSPSILFRWYRWYTPEDFSQHLTWKWWIGSDDGFRTSRGVGPYSQVNPPFIFRGADVDDYRERHHFWTTRPFAAWFHLKDLAMLLGNKLTQRQRTFFGPSKAELLVDFCWLKIKNLLKIW